MTKPKKKLATLVLNPKLWLRGRLAWVSIGERGPKELNSYLVRPSDSRMCCLGFECRRRGLSAKALAGFGLPSQVLPATQIRPFLLLQSDGADLETGIARINDSTDLPLSRKGDLARVRKLRPLFEKLGVRLVLGRAK
jgi:hypothetical protein